jgi:antitoxin YefM
MALASKGSEKLAVLMAMLVSEQMPLADVKNRLSEVVGRLEREHGRVVITKHGHPAAVIISVEDLESLEETFDVMGSTALLDDIREALAELSTADVPVLTRDDALRLIAGKRAKTTSRSPGLRQAATRWPGCPRRPPPQQSNSCRGHCPPTRTAPARRSSSGSTGCTAPAAATTG